MSGLVKYAAFGDGFSGEGSKEECEAWITKNGNGRLYVQAEDVARVLEDAKVIAEWIVAIPNGDSLPLAEAQRLLAGLEGKG